MSRLLQQRRRAPKRKAPRVDRPEYNPIPPQPEERSTPARAVRVLYKRRKALEK